MAETEDVSLNDWDILASKWLQRLNQYHLKRVGDIQTAEDLTSLTLLKAWSCRKSFCRSRGTVSQWLHGIAFHVLMDYFRREKTLLSLEDINEPSFVYNIEYHLELQDHKKALCLALRYLSKREAAILQMRYFERLSIQNISQKTCLTENNVRQILYRTLRKLRIYMVE